MAIANGHADNEEEYDDSGSHMTGSSHENQPEINVELALNTFVSNPLQTPGFFPSVTNIQLFDTEMNNVLKRQDIASCNLFVHYSNILGLIRE